jgi:hypothetical protein
LVNIQPTPIRVQTTLEVIVLEIGYMCAAVACDVRRGPQTLQIFFEEEDYSKTELNPYLIKVASVSLRLGAY